MARTPKLVPPDDDYDDDVDDRHGKHTKVDLTYTLLHGTALRHSRNFVHLTFVQLLHIVLVLPGAKAGEEVAVDAKLGGEGFPNAGVELDQLLGGRGVEPEGRVAVDHLQCFVCMYC